MKSLLLSAVFLLLCLFVACGGSSSGGHSNTPTPTLHSIAVTTASSSIAVNQTAQFTAMGTYSDGSTKDLSSTVAWSSTSPSIASISSSGLATAKAAGTTFIIATASGVSGNFQLTVTNPLLSIMVTPPNQSVGKGGTVQFRATGLYADGSTQNLTSMATWSSTDPTVAAISNSGLVMALQPGVVTVSATDNGISGSTALTVTQPTVVSVSVSPSNPSIIAGLTQQFTAMATYTDSSVQDVTATATWGSSNPSVATTPVAGLTTGLKQGTVTIAAMIGGVTGTTSLMVTPAEVVSISVTPAMATSHPSFKVAFNAMAKMTDGTTQDITFLSSTTWNSDTPAVATISNSTGTNGQASCVAAGTANITASSSNGLGGTVTSNTAVLTVLASNLQTIALTPPGPTIPLGTYQQFTATGTYDDGTTEDLTRSASWASTDNTIATVLAGQAAAIGIGTTNITASQAGVTSTAAIVTTDASQLASLQIQPANAQIGLQTSQQFTATGTFQNGSTLDVTNLVTWKSKNEKVALILQHKGLATAKNLAGSSVITATLGSASQTATLNVSPATLTTITVSPPNSTLPVHATQTFSATGTFSDGTNQTLTSADVTWTSSSAKNVTIGSTNGLATAKMKTGSTPVTITATFNGTTTVTGSTPMNVSAATLQLITVNPSDAVLAPGSSLNYTATGVYSDGTKFDVTTAASWSSSLTDVASLNNNVATAAGPGSTSITASLNGMTSADSNLLVEDAPPTSIAVTPATVSLPQQVSSQLQATGTFADGKTQDLSNLVFWSSDMPSAATVNNDPGAEGLVTTGTGMGTASISAVLGGQTSASTVNATGATLISLTLSPANPTLTAGTTQQFTATATFSDMSTLDVTSMVSWSSSNAAAGVISPTGLATAIATGQTNIKASLQGQSATTILTVQ